MSEKEYCCLAMMTVLTRWGETFFHPIYIDPTTHDMKSGSVAVRLHVLTESGKVSRTIESCVALLYCPFCGTKLIED